MSWIPEELRLTTQEIQRRMNRTAERLWWNNNLPLAQGWWSALSDSQRQRHHQRANREEYPYIDTPNGTFHIRDLEQEK